jgi:hypothetical protein
MTMHLQVTSLDMRYSFETKTTTSTLRAVLPTGRELEFEVSEEEINVLMALDHTEPQSSIQVTENPLPEEPRLLEWALLSDQILEPSMKDALYRAGLPPTVTEDQLVDAMRSIVTVTESNTSHKLVSELGIVERGVQLPSQPRSRRVESDERGNPVVEPRAVPVPDDIDDDTGARSI